jgi:hypothetical protein
MSRETTLVEWRSLPLETKRMNPIATMVTDTETIAEDTPEHYPGL